MAAHLRADGFDPYGELTRHQASLEYAGKYGATVSFVGTMRDFNDGEPVRALTLEHYPGMTETHLARLGEDAKHRWDVLDTLIVHRIGRVTPNEPIVLVAVWARHRAQAFDAARFIIDELKSRAPLWKKEELADGTRWVEHNTPGR